MPVMTVEQHMMLISALQNRLVSDVLREAVLDLSDSQRLRLEATLGQLIQGREHAMANPATGDGNRIVRNVVHETVGSYPQLPESIYEKVPMHTDAVVIMGKKVEPEPTVNKFNMGAE